MPDRRFNIPIDTKTLVTDQVIVSKGVEYAVSRISSLTFSDSKQSYNFVPISRIRSLTVGFSEGSHIAIWCQHPILQKTKFENVAKAFHALSECTFQQRLKRYTDAWATVGYFDYQRVRIHSNGTIEDLKKPQNKVSLCSALTDKRLSFGAEFGVSWIGYSASDPAYVAVYDQVPKGLFSKTTAVGFDCNENRDVILTIIQAFDKRTN